MGLYNEVANLIGADAQNGVDVYIDNASAIKLTKNPEFHGRTKHIHNRHHFIRELVENKLIRPIWISGTQNPADLLTKALAKPAFMKIVEKMGQEQHAQRSIE